MRITDPKSTFALFLTDEMVMIIASMTNLQGRRTIEDWRDLDADEVRAYVGLLILSGVYRSRHESLHSLFSEKTGRPIFRATMSVKRFQHITRAFRFDDKLSRPRRRGDKLAPIRRVWDIWVHRLQMLFCPDTEVCVDEQLVPFKGRCGFRQYMPKKPAKYGLKVWALCDVKTSYAWKVQVYTGKEAGEQAERSQGMRVVLELTDGLKGHTVTCDNFFTSFPLADALLKRKMALVGTIRKNKPELPPVLLQTKGREVHSSIFAFKKNHTLVSYVPRCGKNVLLLSTKHRSPSITDDKRKPKIITDYNKCKGGVDNLDEAAGSYTCRRRTARWPVALFHHLLDVSLYNGYILWKETDPSWHRAKSYRRRLYIEEVGEMLVQPWIVKRGYLPRSSLAADVVRSAQAAAAGPSSGTQMKSRRQCQFCSDKRRRVVTTCCHCGKVACRDHSLSICKICST
uniref:PiggyBac transposable element-derived protein domain-containing protein n=2 Tax=Astatotilapia calliptera TaxID=8154 RepID=A0AAX7T7S3_ASTCA